MAMIVGMQYRPVLDLDFGRMKSLTAVVGPTPSFTRASTGTYFNSSGVLTTAAINEPRFDHVYNGSSWVSKGLLIEEQRTNLCTYSSNQLNAAWAVFNATVTASSETDPAGGTSVFRVAETTTSDQRHIVYQSVAPSASTFTYSVFAKAQERNWLQIIAYDYPNLYFTWFNLSTGVVGTNAAGNTATITAVGNGWYRCSVTRTAASAVLQYFQTGPANGDNNAAYAGDPTKGLLIYGAQIETGAFPTSYIPTTVTVTRSADVCQITGSDFSGIWNASESSFAVEYDVVSTTPTVTAVFYANDGTVNNSFRMYANSGAGATEFYSRTAYVTDGVIVLASTSPSSAKIATGQKLNDFAGTLNGAAVVTDNSAAMPTGINRLDFGVDHVGNRMNGHIARLRYFNTRLTNATLRFLTGGSGAFQPDNISGLQFWVDAADSATLYTDSTLTTLAVSDGDVIGGWSDKSGNGRNVLQANGTNKPILKLNIQNSKNAIRFDGVTKSMSTAASFATGLFTIFIVAKKDSTSRKMLFCSGDYSTSNFNLDRWAAQNYLAIEEQTSSAGLYSLTPNTSIVCDQMTFKRNSLSGLNRHEIRVNGAGQSLTTTGTLDPSGGLSFPYTVGTFTTNATASNWDGDIYEILLYNSSLSLSNILLVEAYLKTKWGTP